MPTVLDPMEVTSDVGHCDDLIHLSDPPYTHGICGAPLKFPGELCMSYDVPADCVVCIDLDRHLP